MPFLIRLVVRNPSYVDFLRSIVWTNPIILQTLTCLVLALGSVPGTSQGIGRNCVQRGPHVDCSSFTDTFSSTANTINVRPASDISPFVCRRNRKLRRARMQINLQDSIPRRESSPHWDSAPRCFTYPDGFNRCESFGTTGEI